MEGKLILSELDKNDNSQLNENLSQDKNQKSNEEKILLFEDLNIYVEIFNNTIDQSDLLDEVLVENGANV